MRFFDKKIFLIFSILAISIVKAQDTPGAPCGLEDSQPCDVTSPIDMYVYVLMIVAILAIAYFAKNYKTQKI
ncbi:signal peptidase [Chryseobacterium indoltheticum]|uniref:Signal peptidase n=1 Tax=Chryseobacterium indoltheticum TaxID=254 RepID=A0A3G6N4G7_9FLAO|nr:signal peptidase [Chryseobacterium indoltheticum]AZA62377.1 signal peptidase [Chryseobacterium indoltheticum]